MNPAETASPLLTHTCGSSLPYGLVANQSLSLAQVPGEGPQSPSLDGRNVEALEDVGPSGGN